MKRSNNKQTSFTSTRAMIMFNAHKQYLLGWLRRRQLTNKGFSVICNNCFAGVAIYQKLGLKYTTPFVGLWFYSDDYIRFLENLNWYLNQPLVFTKVSKHPEVNKASNIQRYPIGVLGGDVEIQFVHYKSEKEAEEKWGRRVKRVNLDNLFFIYCDQNNFKDEYLVRYERLPFKNKIFFSAKPRDSKISIFIEEYKNQNEIGNSLEKRESYYEKYIDLIKWLNGNSFIKKRKNIKRLHVSYALHLWQWGLLSFVRVTMRAILKPGGLAGI